MFLIPCAHDRGSPEIFGLLVPGPLRTGGMTDSKKHAHPQHVLTMLNLVIVGPTVWTSVGGAENFGPFDSAPLGWGVSDP